MMLKFKIMYLLIVVFSVMRNLCTICCNENAGLQYCARFILTFDLLPLDAADGKRSLY
jgi:hypothetical protein